jgi:hypothetical protein
MPWHQRFIFCSASTPRPRPGSLFALLRLCVCPRSCWNSTIKLPKVEHYKTFNSWWDGKGWCELWVLVFSLFCFLVGYGEWQFYFRWCSQFVGCSSILGGVIAFALFFLVDSRPLRRRWSRVANSKMGCTGVKCFQIFLLLNVCRLCCMVVILVGISGFMDGGGMPLYGKPDSLLRLCNFSLPHEFQ